MKYQELKGLCKNCLGCNRLETPEWTGTYRCKYATAEQCKEINYKSRLNEHINILKGEQMKI